MMSSIAVLGTAMVAGCSSDGDLVRSRTTVTPLPEAAAVTARPGVTEHVQVRAVGDLDGDGMDELVVRDPDFSILGDAPSCDPARDECTIRGAMYLVYGRRDWSEITDLAASGVRIEADVTYGRGGLNGLPAGDLDGDGYGDLLVVHAPAAACAVGVVDGHAVHSSPLPPDARHARIYVVYGGPSRVQGPVRIGAVAAATLVDPTECTLEGNDLLDLDRIGFGLGDIDDDGLADVAIGHSPEGPPPEQDQGDLSRQGESFLYYGRRERLAGVIDLAAGADATVVGAGAHNFAEARGMGDVDGDGIDDWIAGSAAYQPVARAYLVRGDRNRLHGRLALGELATVTLTTTSLDLDVDDFAGGDLDGDGRADLVAIRSRSTDTGELSAVIYYGRADLPSTLALDTEADAEVALGAGWGAKVIVADQDRDGLVDLIVGHDTYRVEHAGPALGAVHVIRGAAVRLQGQLDMDIAGVSYIGALHERTCGSPGSEHPCSFGDRAGTNVSAGDLDGDGRDDLLVVADPGAPYARSAQERAADQRVYLLFGAR